MQFSRLILKRQASSTPKQLLRDKNAGSHWELEAQPENENDQLQKNKTTKDFTTKFYKRLDQLHIVFDLVRIVENKILKLVDKGQNCGQRLTNLV